MRTSLGRTRAGAGVVAGWAAAGVGHAVRRGPLGRQAADAVRGRLDWKYLVGLELADPGFDHSVLTEFRNRLIAGDAGIELLDRVLEAAAEHGLLKAGGRARTDSTIVLCASRQINGLVRLGETLRAVLNGMAVREPEWPADSVPADWFDWYANRFEVTRLPTGRRSAPSGSSRSAPPG
ncbi:transposase [Streptomyces sp. NPDC006430]|uniref:transposase n=1 Tax=Streptomyces sp. NPDC006430 TaxID=3154299 RepID=UPI0033AF3D4A